MGKFAKQVYFFFWLVATDPQLLGMKTGQASRIPYSAAQDNSLKKHICSDCPRN